MQGVLSDRAPDVPVVSNKGSNQLSSTLAVWIVQIHLCWGAGLCGCVFNSYHQLLERQIWIASYIWVFVSVAVRRLWRKHEPIFVTFRPVS